MTVFGDTEPEDSWDIGDPVDALAANIRRRVAAVIEELQNDPPALEPIERRLLGIWDDLDVIVERLRR
jgi:hypothetical protein